MKYYSELLRQKTQFINGKIETIKTEVDSILGSDAIYILDGRNNLATMITDSRERKEQMKNFFSDCVGFRIRKGSRFSDNNPILYTEIPKVSF